MLVRMSTYSVVVALHIIAVIAAYGLPLSAPLIVPYVRRHHPDALPGLHAAQHFVNNAITGPFTVLLLAFGLYLAIDGDRWGDPFVAIGIGAVAIIARRRRRAWWCRRSRRWRGWTRVGRVRPRLPALSAGRDASSAPWSCSRSSRWRPNRSHKRIRVGCMSLAQLLTETAAAHPDRPALKLDDTVLNYAFLNEAATRVAGLLKEKGVAPGDRVGIMLPNVPYFAAAYYGILRAGGVVVPMNVLLKGREVGFYLSDSGAKVVFAWHGFAEAATEGAAAAGAEVILVEPGKFEQLVMAAPRAEADEPRAGDDTAVILYTSGTTGTPKGAELTHDNLRANCTTTGSTLIGISEQDVVLGALPLFHSFGQTCGLNAAVAHGSCLTLIPRFDPVKALEIIARDEVTVLEGVPTMYHAMLNAPGHEDVDTSSLRVCVSGGSAMPVEVMKAFEREFDCMILEGYGLSETSPVASFNHPDRDRKPGSIGTPIEGVEMKLVDDDGDDVAQGEVGEIVIRGHNVMKGYWGRADATAEVMKGGWFASGDMATVDEDGYFFIVDRKKDMIIRGGYNVYPREIEEVLYEHPAVSEVAVVGVPDDSLGEEVAAAVVLKSGAEASADDLRAYAKERVAAYKYPRRIWFPDELPKGPTGKILKREIKAPEAVEQ